MICKFEYDKLFTDGNANKDLFGTRTNTVSNAYTFICGGENYAYSGYGNTNIKSEFKLEKDVKYVVEKNKGITKVNNNIIEQSTVQTF